MDQPWDKPLLKVGDLWEALDELPLETDLSVEVLVNEFSPDEEGEVDCGRRVVYPYFRLGYSIDLTAGDVDRPVKHATLTFDMRPNIRERIISTEQIDELRVRS